MMTRRSLFTLLSAGFAAAIAAVTGKAATLRVGDHITIAGINAVNPRFRQQSLEDLAFYQGNQWPAEVLAARAAMGRPCLVKNRLPELVRREMEQTAARLTDEEEMDLISRVVREHRDRQMFLNYVYSAKAELPLNDRTPN